MPRRPPLSNAGAKPKWGEPTSALAVRWPCSHREFYEQRAKEQGLSFSEYIVRVLAEAHGLKLPASGKESDGQLPLTA